MLYTMKIHLLPNEEQYFELESTMRRFNEICNYISKIAHKTNTRKNKIYLQKACYYIVREEFDVPSQLVVRAISRVVEEYKMYKKGSNEIVSFNQHEPVFYDSKIVSFKWVESVSITTISGRMKMPFVVCGYTKGSYDARRIAGHADLFKENNDFYLLLVVDLPNFDSKVIFQ